MRWHYREYNSIQTLINQTLLNALHAQGTRTPIRKQVKLNRSTQFCSSITSSLCRVSKSCLFPCCFSYPMSSQKGCGPQNTTFFDCISLLTCHCFSSNIIVQDSSNHKLINLNNHGNSISVVPVPTTKSSVVVKTNHYYCGASQDHKLGYALKVRSATCISGKKREADSSSRYQGKSLVPVIMSGSNSLFRSSPLTSSDEPRLMPKLCLLLQNLTAYKVWWLCLWNPCSQRCIWWSPTSSVNGYGRLQWGNNTITVILWYEWIE